MKPERTPYNYLLIFLLIIFISSCGNETKKSEAQKQYEGMVLSGKVKNIPDTTLTFSYYTYDFLDHLRKENVDFKDGKFKLKLDAPAPLKGWFSFGKVPVQERFKYTNVEGKDTVGGTGTFDFQMVYMYLNPGDSLHVTLDRNNIDKTLKFSGSGVDNNRFVNAEENHFNDYKHKFLNNWYDVANRKPNDYKNVSDLNYNAQMSFLKRANDSLNLSPGLVDFYANNYYADKVGAKINYPSIHSSYNNNEPTSLPEDYYDFINDVSMDKSISKNGIGYFYNLRTYLKKKYELASQDTGNEEDFYDWIGTELSEKQRYEYMAYSLNGDFSRRLYEEFHENSPYPEMAQAVREKYKHMEGMMEGNPAPIVTFKNMKGQSVSIEDFKGKYAYLDLWATWCGPCIKEMPSLKKLQKKYSNANIQFISISVDDKKDHEKWQDFVKKENLLGTQLIADKEVYSKLSVAFNIKMIPRFILLDPQGNIVDATAPFPSDPALEKLFKNNNI